MSYPLRRAAVPAALLVLASLSGCAIVKVEATERGNLAKAVMQRDPGIHQAALEAHTYASKESTAGGHSVGGGGCGCN